MAFPDAGTPFSLDRFVPRHDSERVDIVFVIDCTASMGSYIVQAQHNITRIAEIISRTSFNVRFALVEYRDHPPEEETFVARVHEFTSNVDEMNGWVGGMSAVGGGDIPEAVADGLSAVLTLTFRPRATKICILIADAPPHGLGIRDITDGMPDGCPSNIDPVQICHDMAQRGIILYCVGCEPSLVDYKDFFMGLSHITGGQYISLLRARHLSKVIINVTREEVQNEQLMGHVHDHLDLEFTGDNDVTVDELTRTLHEILQLNNNQTLRVQVGQRNLEPVSELGRRVSYTRSLHEVCQLMQGEYTGQSSQEAQETFDITALDVVSPHVCERLVRRALARSGRPPVEHSDVEMGE